MLRDVFYYGKKPNVHPKEKHVSSLKEAKLKSTTETFWIINEFCNYKNFDWDFDFEILPDEDVWTQDHNNIWPSQHQKDSGTWLCSKNLDAYNIYRADVGPIYRKNEKNEFWTTPESFDDSNFDYSWHPDATSSPYIYQFITTLGGIEFPVGPTYTTPNNDGTTVPMVIPNFTIKKYVIKTTLRDLINEHPDEIFWAIRDNINYSNFNFNWLPSKQNVYHINVFGSPESEITQTYFVNGFMIKNGYEALNFIDEDQKIDEEYLNELFKPMDMFFIDRGNVDSEINFNKLKDRFPEIKKTRYLNSWVDTINRCISKSETELFWVLNSELDYSEFDFKYYPNPWQMKMVHVFGTQWSHWGTTFIVNKNSFPQDTKYVKIIEHLSCLNFVKKSRAKANSCNHDVFYIDFGNDESNNILDNLKQKISPNVNVIPYTKDYLNTFKLIISKLPEKKEHYIWICSSMCNYDNFDFTYICDPFTLDKTHVFPSDKQKYGDTFFVNVNKLRSMLNEITDLTELTGINFNKTQIASRVKVPEFVTTFDTHTELINFDHKYPYAIYTTSDNKNLSINSIEPISLWSDKTKNILIASTGATKIVVPKEAKNYITNELYDYPYIKKLDSIIKSNPLDIVFLSNGEKSADENYQYLIENTKHLPNRVVRVDGVNGRVNAYHAAVNASNTPWCFTVFAKLKINKDFDWSWQPDRLQLPKHYIFTATNPVNGLVYGHQAMIAYNKNLTLKNSGVGLDFTLDDLHEVVDLNSGVALFNTDEYSTWRTSFREAIKLKYDAENNLSEESIKRLHIWRNNAVGDYAEWSLKGANDAVDFYNEISGDFEQLKLSYEWEWLKERFDQKYKS